MTELIEPTFSVAKEHIFCPEQLIERCLGKIDFAIRVLDVFLSHVQSDIDALLAAVRAGDQDQVVKMAHRMKGSAASISARRLQSLMADIEEAGRRDEIPDLEVLQHRIRDERQSLERALTEWSSKDRPVAQRISDSLRDLPRWRTAF